MIEGQSRPYLVTGGSCQNSFRSKDIFSAGDARRNTWFQAIRQSSNQVSKHARTWWLRVQVAPSSEDISGSQEMTEIGLVDLGAKKRKTLLFVYCIF